MIKSTPNSTHNNFVKEKMNQEYTFANINEQKQELARQIAHLTIGSKKIKIMNKPFEISIRRNNNEPTNQHTTQFV